MNKRDIKTVPITEIVIGNYQVWSDMPAEKYEMFKEDIAKNGVSDLLHVDENNVLLDGHHRYKASLELGIADIEVRVHYGLSEDEKLEKAHTLNTQTREISREEKISKVIELRKQGRSQRQIANWVGVGNATVHRWLVDFATAPCEAVAKIEGADGKERPITQMPKEVMIELENKALYMREQGATLKEIAEELGVNSPRTAKNYVDRARIKKQDEEKRKHERKRRQRKEEIEIEVKQSAEESPDYKTDQPELSATNRLIHATKSDMPKLTLCMLWGGESLPNVAQDAKVAFLHQVKLMVEAGLLILNEHEETYERRTILGLLYTLLGQAYSEEGMEKLQNNLEGFFNEKENEE